MIANPTRPRLLARDLPTLLFLVLFVGATELLYDIFPFEHGLFTLTSLGMVATAVVLFLSFRVGEAYERWWEARKLWGALVNDSRTFARQVLTLVTPDRLPPAIADDARVLVHRHIAYLYALRTALRKGGRFEAPDLDELRPWLDDADLAALADAPNIPTWLNFRQGRHLATLCGPAYNEQQVLLALDDTLRRFLDIQGGCERIKNTVFPASVTLSTRFFVWTLGMAIPLAIVNTEGLAEWVEVLASVLTSFMFIKMEQVGGELKNPFEGAPDDTPMSALCRTIERDLVHQLGETPRAPLQAVDGVLM